MNFKLFLISSLLLTQILKANTCYDNYSKIFSTLQNTNLSAELSTKLAKNILINKWKQNKVDFSSWSKWILYNPSLSNDGKISIKRSIKNYFSSSKLEISKKVIDVYKLGQGSNANVFRLFFDDNTSAILKKYTFTSKREEDGSLIEKYRGYLNNSNSIALKNIKMVDVLAEDKNFVLFKDNISAIPCDHFMETLNAKERIDFIEYLYHKYNILKNVLFPKASSDQDIKIFIITNTHGYLEIKRASQFDEIREANKTSKNPTIINEIFIEFHADYNALLYRPSNMLNSSYYTPRAFSFVSFNTLISIDDKGNTQIIINDPT